MKASSALLSKLAELNHRIQISLPECLACGGTIILTTIGDTIPTHCEDCAPSDILCIECEEPLNTEVEVEEYEDASLLCFYCSTTGNCIRCSEEIGDEGTLCDECFEITENETARDEDRLIHCQTAHFGASPTAWDLCPSCEEVKETK